MPVHIVGEEVRVDEDGVRADITVTGVIDRDDAAVIVTMGTVNLDVETISRRKVCILLAERVGISDHLELRVLSLVRAIEESLSLVQDHGLLVVELVLEIPKSTPLQFQNALKSSPL